MYTPSITPRSKDEENICLPRAAPALQLLNILEDFLHGFQDTTGLLEGPPVYSSGEGEGSSPEQSAAAEEGAVAGGSEAGWVPWVGGWVGTIGGWVSLVGWYTC